MDLNNDLNVDGSITASGRLGGGGGEQAMSAGDVVLLGDDGLIPESLLPDTGGEKWERIPYNSTLVVGDVYKIRCIFGEATFVFGKTSSESEVSTVCFPSVVSSYTNRSSYRSVEIKDGRIKAIYSGYTYAGNSSSYSVSPSDTTCRLYHLIE